MKQVTLYGKTDCCLCEEARTVIRRVQAETPFSFGEIDITQDNDLHMRYLERIPVVAVDGKEVCELVVDESTLSKALSYSRDEPQKQVSSRDLSTKSPIK